ncbi:pre-mRNA-processing factor 39-like isoform X2 [Ornithodoros turicata]|uniref:pre-mRNA-processing factor 39-like isoform X2 n=1 Tax=Ornithodoros turicata TaxID=34597 RepID=UPI0031392D8D
MHASKTEATNASGGDSKSGTADAKTKADSATTELEKYWQVVRSNPADFTGWTYLLQFVEQENNLTAAREAFDKFFSYYPYCYGYWKKYADMEKKLDSISKAEETFERGVAAIPLSVDLWIHYINFVKTHFKDEDYYYVKVKNLFERAIESSGQDFRSDRLWDMFVTWEQENKNLKEVTAIYERVLQVPTQLYGHHFEKFQEHVKSHAPKDILSTDEFLALRQQYMESMGKGAGGSGEDGSHMELDDDEGEAPPPGVDDALPPGVDDPTQEKEDTRALNDNEAKYIRDKVVEKRRSLFKANEEEVGRRWAFEEGIKRPYFHVKPLERSQLKNWRDYLDFEVGNGNATRTIILFERCMIACALYEDMWIKYVKYLDKADPERVNDVFRRACTIHLMRKPNINLAWAAYEEKQGRYDEAVEVLSGVQERIPDLLEATLRRVNLERRRGNPDKVEELYRELVTKAPSDRMATHYACKLARFIAKVRSNVDGAAEVLKEALKRDPTNGQLYMQLADLGYQKSPPDETMVLEAFEQALISDLTPSEKLTFLQRKLEFLEDFGTDVDKIQETFEEYNKMFKVQATAKKRAAEDDAAGGEKKVKSEMNGGDATAATAVATTAAAPTATTDPSAQYNYAQSWGSYPQAYGYQQQWNTYPATSYYPTH